MSNFQSELAKIQNANASNKLFEEAMRQKLNYMGKKDYLRYFLITIEEYFAWHKQGINGKPIIMDTARVFDLKKCTLEHIYPQSSAIVDRTLEPLKHDIGNLSFWGPNENSKVGNKSFEEKRAFYAKSSISLNRELSTLPSWDVKTLGKRKDELIKIALNVFAV